MSNFPGLFQGNVKAAYIVSGIKTLSSATVAVQMTTDDVEPLWIDVSAIRYPIAIGDSSCAIDLATPANTLGSVIYPADPPLRLYLDNVNKIYIAGQSGAAASFTYYAF